MCGILGYIALNNPCPPLDKGMAEGLDELSRRGPDCKKYVKDASCYLGHTRLSIIDTSAKANQPMTDDSGRYTLVYNGEIFNYQTIREGLKQKGVAFKTNSDTEVLLHLLIQDGKHGINRLNGFFSFCFYDNQENYFLIARDRFGIKPLVYCQTSDAIIFGSEIKAILTLGVDKQIDQQSLQQFFQFNYIPAPNSIFRSIKKLMPSEYLEVKRGKVTRQQYYKYYKTDQQTFQGTYEEAKTKVHDLLLDATQLRMISDVPIGAFLSGGVDSSIVSLLCSKLTKNLHTFSIGFKDEPYFDETKYANLVADKIGSNHSVFKLSNDDLLSHFEDALDYFDEPFADSSALNMYILSKLTKQKITVALSGDGADELFGGYNKHHALWLADSGGLKTNLIKHFGGFGRFFAQSREGFMRNRIRQMVKFSEGLQLTQKERYLTWAGFMDEALLMELTNSKRLREIEYLDRNYDNFNDYLYADFNLVLPNDMLRKVDAMSMSNSLEVRTPFLDYRLIDFVFGLPSSYKIDGHSQKKILKDAFESELPKEIFQRRKQGFEVPLQKWFTGELKLYLMENVFNEELVRTQNLLNWNAIKTIQRDLFSNNPKNSVYNTWALISFQRWYKQYISS